MRAWRIKYCGCRMPNAAFYTRARRAAPAFSAPSIHVFNATTTFGGWNHRIGPTLRRTSRPRPVMCNMDLATRRHPIGGPTIPTGSATAATTRRTFGPPIKPPPRPKLGGLPRPVRELGGRQGQRWRCVVALHGIKSKPTGRFYNLNTLTMVGASAGGLSLTVGTL